MRQWIWRSSWFGWLFGFRTELKPVHVVTTRLELCETELNSIKNLLSAALLDEVYSTREEDGYGVRIHTVDEDIANIGLFPKGEARNQIFVWIEIEDQYQHLQPWFLTPFFGFKVKFKQPVLTLQNSWVEKPRGQ